ncbi:AAA family ATPase [Meridianimarinicoccus sp. RP-17]|uniref:AAA family ATPase n=1 Tax=Meridianimarinicoccus zhengii TaxID=2056810 RepID=UPI000DAE4778|nr:AAA family ATPase [Phycocomes zhengii]
MLETKFDVASAVPASVALDEAREVPAISVAAFCQTDDTGNRLRDLFTHRRFVNMRYEVIDGTVRTAAERFAAEPSPNLIILEECEEHAEFLAGLERLSEVALESTRVIVVGRENDVTLYRQFLHVGVSDYLLMPLDLATLIESIVSAFPDGPSDRRGRVVSFIGAHGGAGSSTIAHNAGWTIAEDRNLNALLIDMDMPFGTASLNFNLSDHDSGLLDLLRNLHKLDQVLIDRLAASPQPKLKVLFGPPNQELGGEEFAEQVMPFIGALHSRVDLTLLDLPNLWSGWTQEALRLSDDIVITATPDLVSLRNLKLLLAKLETLRPHDQPPQYVLNQIDIPKREQVKPEKFVEAIGLKPLAEIRFDGQLFGKSANLGRMLADVGAGRGLLKSLTAISEFVAMPKTAPAKASEARRTGLLGRLVGRTRT